MADIKIVGMIISTGEAGEAPTENAGAMPSELLLIGENGKTYGIQSRYVGDDGSWQEAPIDIIEYDDEMAEEEAPADGEAVDDGVEETADDAADQPPAASFNQGAE